MLKMLDGRWKKDLVVESGVDCKREGCREEKELLYSNEARALH